jgi:hypothetical protein
MSQIKARLGPKQPSSVYHQALEAPLRAAIGEGSLEVSKGRARPAWLMTGVFPPSISCRDDGSLVMASAIKT